MSKRTTYLLGEICDDVAMGPFGSNLKIDNFINEGVPVIRGMNLHEGGFNKKNFAFVSEEKANSLKRCLAYPDDLVFTHRGTLGQVGIIPRIGFEKYLVSQSQMRLSVNKKYLDPKYLYYFFKSSLGQKELLKNTSQVGVPAIANPTKSLKQVEITIPDLGTQKKIASILSSLDNKIELNLQMSKTIESTAQVIFSEWFINFNFPGFDGKLVNELPKGWKLGRLGDVCDKITKGTTPTTLKKQFVESGINFIKVESIDDIGNFIPKKFAFIDEETNDILKRSIVKENDIVFTIAGTLGRVAKVDKSILPANTNQAVAIIRVNQAAFVNFVYFLLRSENFKNTILSKAVHAVQANLSLGVLSDAEIIIPSVDIVDKFEKIINSISIKLLSNSYENRALTEIRDNLLPKLMAEKIEVN